MPNDRLRFPSSWTERSTVPMRIDPRNSMNAARICGAGTVSPESAFNNPSTVSQMKS